MTNPILVPADEYVGAVKFGGIWRYFYNMLSMWILDYARYDPEYDPADARSSGWRESLLVVDTHNATDYIGALSVQEIPKEDLATTESEFGGAVHITFVVNFDEKLFVNGWHDNIPIHEYVPVGWHSMEGDPHRYLPADDVGQ